MSDSNYELGDLGMSIPLDAALTLGDFTKVSKVTLLVNIETLIRNALGSYLNRDKLDDSLETIHKRLEDDISALRYHMETTYQSDVVVYKANYSTLKMHSIGIPKVPKTEKQIASAKLHQQVLEKVSDLVDITFDKGRLDNPGRRFKNVLLVSHYPVDLLSAPKFDNFRLLESHTGKIKTRKDFSSKLKINKDHVSSIPLVPLMFIIFGDGVFFNRQNKKMVDTIVDIATKSSWTPLTTSDRVMFSIKRQSPDVYNLISGITSI